MVTPMVMRFSTRLPTLCLALRRWEVSVRIFQMTILPMRVRIPANCWNE
jgi:hypothetical protein